MTLERPTGQQLGVAFGEEILQAIDHEGRTRKNKPEAHGKNLRTVTMDNCPVEHAVAFRELQLIGSLYTAHSERSQDATVPIVCHLLAAPHTLV